VKNGARMAPGATGVMTQTVARLLLLPTLVVAAAILIKGYAQPGDGFSAGVIASLGIVLQYLAFGHQEAERLPLVGLAGRVAFAGLLVALFVAAVPVILGEPVLTHYPWSEERVVYLGTLELITAVLFDLGIFFLVFGFAVGTIKSIAHAIADEEVYRGTELADAKDGAGVETFAEEEGR
jgi:multisubunit Na+/H+ antiporter MnhB subunit